MLPPTRIWLFRWIALAGGGSIACGGSAPPPDTTPQPAQTEPSETGNDEVIDMAESAGPDAAEESAVEGMTPETGNSATDLSAGETRTMQVIQKTVLDNRDRFRACYDVVEAKEPGIQGDLTLYFVLDASGRVREAELNSARSTLKHEKVVECALSELRKLQFPPSSKGLETKVNYPFNFNPR
jgi:outer membrane biosynthesis protein TonB